MEFSSLRFATSTRRFEGGTRLALPRYATSNQFQSQEHGIASRGRRSLPYPKSGWISFAGGTRDGYRAKSISRRAVALRSQTADPQAGGWKLVHPPTEVAPLSIPSRLQERFAPAWQRRRRSPAGRRRGRPLQGRSLQQPSLREHRDDMPLCLELAGYEFSGPFAHGRETSRFALRLRFRPSFGSRNPGRAGNRKGPPGGQEAHHNGRDKPRPAHHVGASGDRSGTGSPSRQARRSRSRQPSRPAPDQAAIRAYPHSDSEERVRLPPYDRRHTGTSPVDRTRREGLPPLAHWEQATRPSPESPAFSGVSRDDGNRVVRLPLRFRWTQSPWKARQRAPLQEPRQACRRCQEPRCARRPSRKFHS